MVKYQNIRHFFMPQKKFNKTLSKLWSKMAIFQEESEKYVKISIL